MVDGRIESHIIDPEMPPLEDSAVTPTSTDRPSPRPIDNMGKVGGDRGLTEIDLGLLKVTVPIYSPVLKNAPRGRGICLHTLTPRGLDRGRLLNMIVNNLQDMDALRSLTPRLDKEPDQASREINLNLSIMMKFQNTVI